MDTTGPLYNLHCLSALGVPCSGPAILDTAGPLYNLHYLNALGSPRTPNQRKFSEAQMHRKMPLPRGWKRRVRSSVQHIQALGHYHLLEQRTFARRT